MVVLKLTATLKDGEGNPLGGKTIEFYKSTDNVSFSRIATETTDSNGVAETTDEITCYGTYYYKARFPGDETYDASEATASYTYSFDYSLIIQLFMQLILFVMIIAIVSSITTMY